MSPAVHTASSDSAEYSALPYRNVELFVHRQGSSVESSAVEQGVAFPEDGDTLAQCRYGGAAVAEPSSRDTVIGHPHNMRPMGLSVAKEGRDLGTSSRAYHLPTTSQARRRHRHSGRCRRIVDIVGTLTAIARGG